MDEVLPGAPATAVRTASRQECRGMAAVDRARAGRRGRRHVGGWRPAPAAWNPLANATFSRVTDWEGTEEQAEISPDGRFVAFVADRLDSSTSGSVNSAPGDFDNLTPDIPPMVTPGNILRSLGFNGDGSEIWFNPRRQSRATESLMPLTGGTPRPFLRRGHSTPSWSPDNARLVFIGTNEPGDPLSLADRTGADAHPIVPCRGQGRSRFSGKACTRTTRCGQRTASGSTSCTGRDRPAGWTYGA